MRRYVSEKELGLGRSLSTSKQFSHKNSVRDLAMSVQIPQDISSSSKMLKMLKKVNTESQILKGRLSVLQIRQHRQDFKAQSNSNRYKEIKMIREEMERQQQKKDQHLKKLMEKMSQSKKNVKAERQERRNNIKRAQNELYMKNSIDYKKSKERRHDLTNRIIEQRMSKQRIKRQRAIQIKEEQKMQKTTIRNYRQNRKKGIKQADSSESLRFSRVALEKMKQMQELAALESQIILKQVQSRRIIEDSEDKLRKLLQSKHSVRESQKVKLPQLVVPQSKRQAVDKAVKQA